MNYQNICGSKAEVRQSGKSFEVAFSFPASKRVPAEVKVIRCKSWSGVERQLKRFGMEAVA